jgi:DNA polymerase-1
VVLLRFISGADPQRWTDDEVRESFGHDPERWPLVTALQGDVSDNILGVPGIGPKRAVKLLERNAWDLEEALVEIPEHRDLVRMNFRLVNLREPLITIALPDLLALPKSGTEQGSELEKFFQDFELKTLGQRFRHGHLWTRPVLPGRSHRSERRTP